MLIFDLGVWTTSDVLGGALIGVVKTSPTCGMIGEVNLVLSGGDVVEEPNCIGSSEYSTFFMADQMFLCSLAFGTTRFHPTEDETYK